MFKPEKCSSGNPANPYQVFGLRIQWSRGFDLYPAEDPNNYQGLYAIEMQTLLAFLEA
jgi:hypothetical protein